ncbi:MAG: RDD family protein [Patescibacteria group bacterium]|nr:RDD family protein [Patescibacteria group bacterium]
MENNQNLSQSNIQYAGFWRRFFALLIDNLILGSVYVLSLILSGISIFGSLDVYLSYLGQYLLGQILFSSPTGSVFTPDIVSFQEIQKFSTSLILINLIFIFLSVAYFVVMTVIYGGTVGKLLLRIRVVDQNYQRINWARAIMREVIGKLISYFVFTLGFLWVAWDVKKQGWHDKIAGTFVLKL